MGTHDVGLGRGQLGIDFLRIDILRSPNDCLADRHPKKVLPADGLFVRILEGLPRHHPDRTAAGFDLLEERVVTQAGRNRVTINIISDQLLE